MDFIYQINPEDQIKDLQSKGLLKDQSKISDLKRQKLEVQNEIANLQAQENISSSDLANLAELKLKLESLDEKIATRTRVNQENLVEHER